MKTQYDDARNLNCDPEACMGTKTTYAPAVNPNETKHAKQLRILTSYKQGLFLNGGGVGETQRAPEYVFKAHSKCER